MGFWVIVALIGFTVLGELLRPKPDSNAPKAAGIGDFTAPTVDATRAIPIAFGTVLQKGPNVTWYGDLTVKPITQSVRTSLFSSNDVTVGYRYFLGMQLAICHGPVDVLRSIRFGPDGEKVATLYGATDMGDHTRYTFTKPGGSFALFFSANARLFGGDDGEGGIAGPLDFYPGSSTQAPNDYLEAAIGTALPGYHFVSYVVFRHCYLGNSQYLKDVSFEISRFPNGLGLTGGAHIIGTYDCNPACALYEILIDPVWGLGRPTGEIDLASFQAAGNALAAEGLGLSMIFDTQATARDVCDQILRHVDGVIFTDPSTGLLTFALARADYDPLAIPVLTESMIRDVEFSRPSWSELSNAVALTYTSRADNYTERVAPWQNAAGQRIVGERIVEKLDFRGISRAEVAVAVAAREGKTLSYPLATARIFVNRQAWALRPASVFKLNWPADGISGMICRVVKIDYGTLEEGEITIEAVEDIFAVGATAFSPPPASSWVDPVGPVSAPTNQQILEAPYHLVGAEELRAMALVARPDGPDLGFQIWSDRAGGTSYTLTNTTAGFTPAALTVAPYAAFAPAIDPTGFLIQLMVDTEDLASISAGDLLRGVNLCLIDSEIFAFQTVTDNGDGTFTISDVIRGVFDTVPADHSDNVAVYFLAPAGAFPVDPGPAYPAPCTVNAKLLPFNARAVLDIATATPISLPIVGRAKLPYPPGNVKIGGVAWPSTVTAGVDHAVTWAIRNRVAQLAAQTIVAQDAGDYGTVSEGNYTIQVYVDGVLKRTVSALTGPAASWTWTAAFQAADGATAGHFVEIRVIPVNGSLVGNYQSRTFAMV
jgi:hypothetical protein